MEIFQTPDAKALGLPFNSAVRAGETLYLSGVLGNLPATIGALAAARSCSIRRIGDYEIEARRIDAGDFLLPQVGADRAYRLKIVQRRIARDHFGKVGLNLDRDNFARPVDRRDHYRDDAASRTQLQNAFASTCARETAEQNRLD